jgi:CRISPR-associated protein Cas1
MIYNHDVILSTGLSMDTPPPPSSYNTIPQNGNTGDFYARLCDPLCLMQAWGVVRKGGSAAGGDGVGLRAFAPRAGMEIERAALRLRQGGYHPGPFRFADIPKKSGGTRRLAIPCLIDRIIQRAAADLLVPVMEPEFEECSFAYRPGRSVKQAVACVSRSYREGYRWVVDADIDSFFDRVPHDLLLAELGRYVADVRFCELIELWLHAYASETGVPGRGLPQGSPLSPLLSNLYLDQLDEEMEKEKGLRIVRFADDFVVMAKSRAQAERSLDDIAALLESYGLEMNADKSRVVAFTEGFDFLGHVLVRSIALPAPEEQLPAVSSAPVVVPIVSRTDADVDGDIVEDESKNKTGDHTRAQIISPLYVMEAGRILDRRNKSLVVRSGETEVLALPPERIDRIDIGPQASATDRALRLAGEHDIPVFFLDGHGAVHMEVTPPVHDRFGRHLQQASHILEPERRLVLARSFVDGRTQNQQALLRRLNRRRKNEDVARTAEKIMRLRRKLPLAETPEALMGYEGEITKLYWPALGACLEHGFTLRRRTRQPPGDPANALLNWIGWFLARDVQILISRAGLHPGFGILHGVRDGHLSLVYDFMEEFRAPLVEGLAIYLLNNRIVQEDDFSPFGAAYGVKIIPLARAKIIRGWEEWLDRPIKSPHSGKTISWRALILEQIWHFLRVLEGRDEVYKPYKMDY